MEIFKYLKDDLLIVTNESFKKHILSKTNAMYRLKFMTIKELIQNFTFSYDERAIYYLMKKYDYHYDVAKMYLENLYYIDDINNPNILKLKEIKQELEDHNLLKTNRYFKQYLKSVQIIVYNYELNKFEQKIIDEIKKLTNLLILKDEIKPVPHTVYEFSTMEEEITYVATKIIELINNNIPLSSIKIVNIDETYFNPIKRIFSFFNLDVDLKDDTIYSNLEVSSFIKTLKEEKNLKRALKEIKSNNEIYENILNICNKYTFSDTIDKYIIQCIEEEVKKIKVTNLKENIKVCNLGDNINNDDYIFLMNFNQNSIPKIYKDEDYLSDKVKMVLGLDTSISLNYLEEKKAVDNINKIKNLTITYKLKTLHQAYYKSSLIDQYDMTIKKIDNTQKFYYSNLYNKIELSKALDKLIKYNEHSKYLDVLANSTFYLDYLTYDNKFTGIESSDLLDYLDHKLLLSYSSIDNYYRCSFRYYVNNILKLNKYEETFSMFIGNLFHYILSMAFKTGFDFEVEFNNYIDSRQFTAKESFFINKLKKELIFIINTIKKQNTFSHFDKELYEEKIYINKAGNVKITFMGIIDKLKYKEINNTNYVAIIDYKTGTPETNLKNSIYGIEMQLPIYLYLVKNTKKIKNAQVMGLYLQKMVNNKMIKNINKNYEEQLENNLKLDGYSLNDEAILKEFDFSYKDSELIKGLKTSSKGFYAYSKVLTKNQIDVLTLLVEKKIKQAEQEIIDGHFNINPKRIGETLKGCEFCQYKELCYTKEEDIVNLEEYKDLSFLENINQS